MQTTRNLIATAIKFAASMQSRHHDLEPAFVDVRDLVEAAKSGRIDAQENPLTNTYNFGTHRYHRHITLSGHFYGMALVLANNAQFESWPNNVQDAITEGMVAATAVQRCWY